MEERLLTIKEISQLLGIREDKILQLIEQGKIPAYRLNGKYLRFKREQIEKLKDLKRTPKKNDYGFFERIKDFFYFYDFYIFCFLIIILLLIVIFTS